jgi:cellulose synthase/poly-beta-1,6-N-acetylglucosamine synthase-like glycosyltransferase
MIQLAANSLPWSAAHSALTVTLIAGGVLAAVFALYPLVLSLAALFYDEQTPELSPAARLVVLVPAHDESELIARCVRSLREQTYPSDLYEIVVIADNCTDDTAAIAAAAGADEVMTRCAPDARGKGRALRWAFDRVLARSLPPDALVMVDADSAADPDLLLRLAQPFQAGARAVQGTYLLSALDLERPPLTVISVMLINRVRPAGFSVLRLPFTHLAGNGMLLSRELLVDHPWTAFANTEDLEYSLILNTAGERIAFAGDAVVRGPAAPTRQAAAQQQLRWHGGKVYMAKVWLPRLIASALRQRRLWLLGIALGLAVPPLGVLMATTAVGTVLVGVLTALGVCPAWLLGPWLLALTSIPLSVLIGMRAVRAPRAQYRALLHAPLYIVRAALRARAVARFGGEKWIRTERKTVPGAVE